VQAGESERKELRRRLKAARETINRLKQEKLLLEDLIMTNLFGLPEEQNESACVGPKKRPDAKSMCYYGRVVPGWHAAGAEEADKSEYTEYDDFEAYQIAAVFQTAPLNPLWNLMVVIRPDTDKSQVIQLLRKITAIIEKQSLAQEGTKLYNEL
jgi:hypothetical protein